LKFRQITKKSYEKYDGKVYDLTVQDSHSYNIENLVVHNSGGGSLVSYALGVTQIDPLKYHLLFERFLNPERGKLPDIDSDFCIEKGPMVFEYIIKKYGKEYCCNVATFGRLQLASVIKDLAKTMGVPFEEANKITKMIPSKVDHIADLEELPEFNEFFDKYPRLCEFAKRLEGNPRHVSQHPAGICVTPIPVTDLIPVQNAKETQEGVEPGYLSQFEKEQCEEAGLVKLDILKLKNVTEIRWQLKEINKRYGLNLTEQDIPLEESPELSEEENLKIRRAWDLICRGDTLGVFQLAGGVAAPVLKKVQPRDIEALSAVNAFIRPGSSGLDEYVAGKYNAEKIRKFDPRLDRHLATTYGAIVYQEQIMFLISELMGISFGQADLYRRALEKPAKDKKGYVEKFNKTVVDIAVSRGFDKEVADLVRQLIIENSGYGFNKSHSVAYSIISYWTAYLKANFPLIFYTTMFNGNIEQLPEFMAEARKLGITIKPPHVCYSKFRSTIESEDEKVIRIGFNAVKGIGPKAVESILESQPYNSIDDFFERNQMRSVNKKVVEAIIGASAFNGLGINIEKDDIPDNVKPLFNIREVEGKTYVYLNRKQLEYWYEKVGEATSTKTTPNYLIPASMIKSKYLDEFELEVEKEGGYVIPEDRLEDVGIKFDTHIEQFKTRKKPKGCFKDDKPKVKIPPFRKPFISENFIIAKLTETDLESYLRENEEFGFSFLQHPLEHLVSRMTPYDSVEDGYGLVVGGIIIELIQRQTANNRKYYWMIIQTPRERVRVTLWDNQYKAYANVIQKYKLVKITGVKGYGGMSCENLYELKPKN